MGYEDAGSGRRADRAAMVWDALQRATGFVSAQQLHQRLTDAGTPIGLATVYRHLNALAEAGRADTIMTESGQSYRGCDPGDHHHHLVCEACGVAVVLDPPDETWMLRAAAAHGFTITRHVVEVFGRCGRCPSAAADGPARAPGQTASAEKRDRRPVS